MDVDAEIQGLRREVAAMAAGLSAIADAQVAQTEILRALLAAATGDDGGEGNLIEAIRELARAIGAQSETLAALRIDVAGIPETVAAAGKL